MFNGSMTGFHPVRRGSNPLIRSTNHHGKAGSYADKYKARGVVPLNDNFIRAPNGYVANPSDCKSPAKALEVRLLLPGPFLINNLNERKREDETDEFPGETQSTP